MSEAYRIVYRGGVGEIIEKKSRFIATVIPISSEDEALAFIEQMKKQYWDASHNCSAYALGMRHEIARCRKTTTAAIQRQTISRIIP